MSRDEQAAFLKVVTDTSYDRSEHEMFAAGALLDGEASCYGYSRAYQLLLNGMGVPCTVVFGRAPTGKRHAWNLVSLQGELRFVDTTFEDHDEVDWGYFLFDQDELEAMGYALDEGVLPSSHDS